MPGRDPSAIIDQLAAPISTSNRREISERQRSLSLLFVLGVTGPMGSAYLHGVCVKFRFAPCHQHLFS